MEESPGPCYSQRVTTPPPHAPPGRAGLSLTKQILIGLGVGVLLGAAGHAFKPEWVPYFKPFSSLFVRLIKMMVAPLIFCSLVAGVAGAGHVKLVGRMALRAFIYFEVVTTLALVGGLAAVNLTQPGRGLKIPMELPDVKPIAAASWEAILVPNSVIEAAAQNHVLHIVVFGLLFAVALGMAGEKGKPVIALCESITAAMFSMTGIVMRYAPIGVGAAIAYTVGHSGLPVLINLARLVLTLYGALIVFLLGVLVPVALLFKIPVRRFIAAIKEPAVIAFTTTSSEAAFPRAMEALEKFGVPAKIVSFVLPFGYSFNLDGSTLYLSLASVFVAQAAGVELTWGQQLTMLLTLMLTSKGVAAVPRASLVILAGTLSSYNLPLAGITLILGVDVLMDMARTCVNLVGNCLATVVVAKWEGAVDTEQLGRDTPA